VFKYRSGFIILVMLIQLPCIGLVSTNVPLTHWSYDAIETLADAGLVQSDLLSTKPFSRLEMGRLIVEAKENMDPNSANNSLYVQLLKRLEGDFTYEHFKDTRLARRMFPNAIEHKGWLLVESI
jgi:hypothetical protein